MSWVAGSKRHIDITPGLTGFQTPGTYVQGDPWQFGRAKWKRGKGLGGAGVYAVFAEHVGRTKIGRTHDLLRRYAGIETACPIPIRLIAWIRGPLSLEQVLHERLRIHRVHLEWFTDCPEVRNALFACVQEFGGGFVDERESPTGLEANSQRDRTGREDGA